MTAPNAPAGLASSGKQLWASVVSEYDLDYHEQRLLAEACRCADRLDRLAVDAEAGELTVVNHRGDRVSHPSLVEARQQAIVFSRLLASLRLPSGEESGRPQRRGGARGSYGLRGVS